METTILSLKKDQIQQASWNPHKWKQKQSDKEQYHKLQKRNHHPWR